MIENKSGVSWFDDNINLPNKEKIIALKKSSPLPEIDFDAKTYKIKSLIRTHI